MTKKNSLALLSLLVLASCVTTQPGNDPVVVTAERDTRLAEDTFALVAQTEQQARPTLVAIDYKLALQIKHGVDLIRVQSKKWVESARLLTKTYKSNRSAANKANLQTALATLEAGLSDAQKYLTQINQITQNKATP